jgi:redox-sensing transcriptional repressor
MDKVSQKKIARVSLYRRRLKIEQFRREYIFSHELAAIANSNAAQVRRDLMKIGAVGSLKKGYNVTSLIATIDKFLDPPRRENVIIAGAGNLGMALLTFFKNRQPKLCLVAAFDIDPVKVGNDLGSNTPCLHLKDMPEFIKKNKVKIGVISTNEGATREVADVMIDSGIRSIINFTCVPLNSRPDVFIEQIDITASFEKAAFFTKNR